MKLNDVIYANFASLAYLNWDGIKVGTDLKDALFDIKKKNTSKLNSRSEHLFAVYSEDPVYQTPLWDSEFNDWEFVYSSNANKIYKDRGVDAPTLTIDDLVGFYAIVFCRDNEVVISFRGTDDVVDMVDDLKFLLGKMNSQVVYAFTFVKQIISKYKAIGENKRFHLTGHSLGGSLVQAIMATELGKEIESAVTFNTFGIRKEIEYWRTTDIQGVSSLFGEVLFSLATPTYDKSCLGELANMVINHKPNSIELESYVDIANILISSESRYVKQGSFNVMVEKDSKMFDNLKYQFGTIPSMKHEDRVQMKEDAKIDIDVDKAAYYSRAHVILDLIRYLRSLRISKPNKYQDKITNYIISHDLVARVRTPYGKVIAVDNVTPGETFQVVDSLSASAIIKDNDLNVVRMHSVGNFFMFMSDDGNFHGSFRKVVIDNIVRDFVEYYSDVNVSSGYITADYNSIPNKIVNNTRYMKKFIFNYIYSDILPQYRIYRNNDAVVLGMYANVKHDGIDYSRGELILKVK